MAELPQIPCSECGQVFDALTFQTHRCKPLPVLTLREHLTKLMQHAAEAQRQKSEAELDAAAQEIGRFVLKHPRVLGPILTPDLSHLIVTAQKIRKILGGWSNTTIRSINMPVDVRLAPKDLMQFVRFSEALAFVKEQCGFALEEWEKAITEKKKDAA